MGSNEFEISQRNIKTVDESQYSNFKKTHDVFNKEGVSKLQYGACFTW